MIKKIFIFIIFLCCFINSEPIKLYESNNFEICSFCKFIVHVIQDELLIGNKTITTIELIIKQICSKLKNKNKVKECYEIIQDIDVIKNLIISGLNPNQICEKIGFCNTTQV